MATANLADAKKASVNVLNLTRNQISTQMRFMNSATYRLDLRSLTEVLPREDMETCEICTACDGANYYYNPIKFLRQYKKTRRLPTRQYLHSVFHCLLCHMFGSISPEIKYWNLACDIAVETILNEDGFPSAKAANAVEQARIDEQKKIVDYIKTNGSLPCITAELVYSYLVKNPPNDATYEYWVKTFKVDEHLWYAIDVEIINANASGIPANSSVSAQAWKNVSKSIQTDLSTFSKGQGSGTNGLMQNLTALQREKYDYSSFLRKFAVMGETMKINPDEFDYNFYTYGLELYGNMPLIEPLEYKDEKRIREFVIAIDTSGSVAGDKVQAFIQKTYNILKTTESFFSKINLHIIQCDADIHEDAKITSQAEFDEYISNMSIKGLGGTDFRPVFEYVNKMVEEKEFRNLRGLIYFTDGYGTFPSYQPEYETAVIYLDDGYNNPSVPPWVIKLLLKEEDI